MSRSTQQRIRDILQSIDRCIQYTPVLSDEDPFLAEMAEHAIHRNLQIIGEATKHLPERITDVHPDIGWPQIRGFRNILVHQYFGVDTDIVRDVVQTHLPPLAEILTPYLER